VTNTGRRAGVDVPELYIADPASASEPPKQLKGYDRVALNPHQSERVSFALDQGALSYWSTSTHSWRVARGRYGLLIERDERDISRRATISVDGASCRGAVAGVVIPSATSCNAANGRLGPLDLQPRLSSARIRGLSMMICRRRRRSSSGS
jgi:Fibronectin type III-like domain